MSHNLVCTRIVQVAQLLSLAVLNSRGTATPLVWYAGLPTVRKLSPEKTDIQIWSVDSG